LVEQVKHWSINTMNGIHEDQRSQETIAMKSIVNKTMTSSNSINNSNIEQYDNSIKMENGNIKMHEVYDNVIVGGGPGGINLAMEFAVRGIPYILLERSANFGGQFRSFPRCGELISLNKKHLPEKNPGWLYARRYDWHTLSTITEEDSKKDPKLLFTNWSDHMFPQAKLFAEYLDYVGNHPNWRIADHSRFNCQAIRITKDDSNRFVIETAEGKTYLAERVFMATGTSRPVVPNIQGIVEHGIFYGDFDPKNSERYRNKRIVILGSGNSAFEVANALVSIAGDTLILVRSVVKFARQTHNVHDVRTQSSVNYDLAQLKALTTISAERVTEITRLENGRLLLKTATPEPHWETPMWRIRDLIADFVIVCCGFEYTVPDVFTTKRVQPEAESTGKFCKLTSTWESTNVPNLYFVGGSMRVNDRDAASGFIHGFRYNIQALGSVIAERHYNQPFQPLFECILDPKCDDTFKPLTKFIINMVSSTAALFELFNYGCSTITFEAISQSDNDIKPTYKAKVWEVVPRDYARQRWANKSMYVGRVEIVFQYGFHLYGENIPTHHFTHPADHFQTELSAYIHPVFHAFRHGYEGMDKFPDYPGQIEEWHLQESLLARWDEDDYKDEGTNVDQYINAAYNAVVAALGMSNRKSTLPVLDDFIDQVYPHMMPDELAETLKREPGLRLIMETKAKMSTLMPTIDMPCHPQKN